MYHDDNVPSKLESQHEGHVYVKSHLRIACGLTCVRPLVRLQMGALRVNFGAA